MHLFDTFHLNFFTEGIKTNFESFKARKRREETGKQEEHNKKMAIRSRMARVGLLLISLGTQCFISAFENIIT